jgi:hypothetical protein
VGPLAKVVSAVSPYGAFPSTGQQGVFKECRSVKPVSPLACNNACFCHFFEWRCFESAVSCSSFSCDADRSTTLFLGSGVRPSSWTSIKMFTSASSPVTEALRVSTRPFIPLKAHIIVLAFLVLSKSRARFEDKLSKCDHLIVW